MSDEQYMQQAIEQATIAGSNGDVPVGALIVMGDQVLATGYNQRQSSGDPTAHAEIMAIRTAAADERNYRLNDTTLYVTLEPCAMCVGAMLQARISRLVFGAYDPKAGAAGSVLDLCDDRRLNHRIEVNGGLLEDQCAGLLKAFFAKRR